MTHCTAIIPIRSGSKGLPGKNVRILGGKPLFMHAVDAALAAGIDDIIVATDDQSVLDQPNDNYRLFARSPQSARDSAPTHEVLLEAIESLSLHSNTIVLLQATSPLRRPETIRAAMTLFDGRSEGLCATVSRIDNSVLKSGMVRDGVFAPLLDAPTLFKPRQALPDLFKLDGAVFVFNGGWLIRNGSLESDHIQVLESPAEDVLDIDTLDDFLAAEARLSQRDTTASSNK